MLKNGQATTFGSMCCDCFLFRIICTWLLLIGCSAEAARTVKNDKGKIRCDDIAIVGAGIAGTYAAWKLRNSHQTITIYEYSNRVGGKMYTTKFEGVPDFNLEIGAMRFKPKSHPRVNKTIHELGLHVLNFKHNYDKTDNTMMYLRGSHLLFKNIGKEGTPFNLKREEMVPYNRFLWNVFVNNSDKLTANSTDNFQVKTKDGVPLYKQSMQSALLKSVSAETMEYIKAVHGWYGDYGDISAVINFPRSDPDDRSDEPFQTVQNGMMEIPETLLSQFLSSSLNRHNIVMNRQLTAITKQADQSYVLTFTWTSTLNDITINTNIPDIRCAKKVILAINRLPLETLDWSGLRQPRIREFITKAVKDVHAAKIYFAYKEPWWRNLGIDFVLSDTPLRQTYDFGTTKHSNISVLCAGYMDYDVSLWDELKKRGESMFGHNVSALSVSEETVSLIHSFLAEIFNTSAEFIPKPEASIMKIWNSFPFGGAWQKWMPGYVWTDVERQMVQPSADDAVYIVSNAFNAQSCSWWAEGVLETVDLMLERINQ